MASARGEEDNSDKNDKTNDKDDHSGHRERVFAEINSGRASDFSDSRLLEALLFFPIKRRDTYKTARDLMENFGSLKGIFNVPVSELRKVKGVGGMTVIFFTLITELFNRLTDRSEKKGRVCATEKQLGDYLVDMLGSRLSETVVAVFMNSKRRVMSAHILKGTHIDCSVMINSFIDNIEINAPKYVAIAHNHPSNNMMISYSDRELCSELRDIIEKHGAEYVGGYLVCQNNCIRIDD